MDTLDNCLIIELPCFTLDGQLLSVTEYLEHITLCMGQLEYEKEYYRDDLSALIEIEWEMNLLHELHSSTKRLYRQIDSYHKER